MFVDASLTPEALAGMDARELDETMSALEREARRIAGLQACATIAAQRSKAFRSRGYRNAIEWIVGSCDVSRPRAQERDRVAKACADMPYVLKGLLDGRIGIEQVALIGRLHANRVIRPCLGEWDEQLAAWAADLRLRDFCAVVERFRGAADPDGQLRSHEVSHARRNASIARIGDSWELLARGSLLDGEGFEAVLEHFVQREFELDWAAAKAVHGDATRSCHLARSARQRRFDALMAMALAAKAGTPAIAGDADVTIVIDPATALDSILHHYGLAVPPIDPATFATRRRETIGGTQLTLEQVYAALSIGRVRTMLSDPRTRTVELGREQRFHNAAMRHAIRILDAGCTHPGCWSQPGRLDAGRMTIDHARPWWRGGETGVRNGDLMCHPHNLAKDRHDLRIRWNPIGRWDWFTADGYPIGPDPP